MKMALFDFIRTAYKLLDSLQHVVLLAIRLWMGLIFWQSGYNKLQDILNGNADSVIYLFEEIHPVPGIPAELAAYAGTFGEVALGAMLIAGLFTRFAAAGLLVMTVVIQISQPLIDTHMLWGLLIAVVLTRGPGLFSADTFAGRIVGFNRSPAA